jgi:hypothetical protein
MPMTAREVMAMIANKYKDKPDDFALSIGHWEPGIIAGIPEFVAYLCLELKDIRRWAKKPKITLVPVRKEVAKETERKAFAADKLPKTHTRQLLKMLRQSYKGNGRYWWTDSQYGPYVTDDEIKQELAKREHIPNKIESRKIRQQKAKAQRNK